MLSFGWRLTASVIAVGVLYVAYSINAKADLVDDHYERAFYCDKTIVNLERGLCEFGFTVKARPCARLINAFVNYRVEGNMYGGVRYGRANRASYLALAADVQAGASLQPMYGARIENLYSDDLSVFHGKMSVGLQYDSTNEMFVASAQMQDVQGHPTDAHDPHCDVREAAKSLQQVSKCVDDLVWLRDNFQLYCEQVLPSQTAPYRSWDTRPLR